MEPNSGTVWIVHDKGVADFTGAGRFGKQVRVLFGNGTALLHPTNPFDIKELVAECLSQFKQNGSTVDWIVLTGSIQYNIAAALGFVNAWGRAQFLIWHAQRGEYVPTEFTHIR